MGEELLWIELGKIHIKLGALDDAVSAFSRAIDENPESGAAYSHLAFIYQQKGELGKAISLYRKCIPLIEDAHSQTLIWNKLGDAYLALKDSENAMAAYEKAIGFEMSASHPSKNQDIQENKNSQMSFHQPIDKDLVSPRTNITQTQERHPVETPGELIPPKFMGKSLERNNADDNEKRQVTDRSSYLN